MAIFASGTALTYAAGLFDFGKQPFYLDFDRSALDQCSNGHSVALFSPYPVSLFMQIDELETGVINETSLSWKWTCQALESDNKAEDANARERGRTITWEWLERAIFRAVLPVRAFPEYYAHISPDLTAGEGF